MENLIITMLGARGVGKTSMLAAMRYDFDQLKGIAGLQIEPDDFQTEKELDARLEELQAAAAEIAVDTRSRLKQIGTFDERAYWFTLTVNSAKGQSRGYLEGLWHNIFGETQGAAVTQHELPIVFKDYPVNG